MLDIAVSDIVKGGVLVCRGYNKEGSAAQQGYR